MTPTPETNGVNTLRESSLHAALKAHFAQTGDRIEVRVDGFVVDLVRDDLLIEIQTGNFSTLKRKLAILLGNHRVHLVYPIAQDRWIVKVSIKDGRELSRRKSPKHGKVIHAFPELVYISHLLANPNLSLEILLIRDEEYRFNDGKGSWRRQGWSIIERRLLEVVGQIRLDTSQDFLALLPPGLPKAFTTADLADALGESRTLARKMVYCLRRMNIISPLGKDRNAVVYQAVPSQ